MYDTIHLSVLYVKPVEALYIKIDFKIIQLKDTKI